MAIKERNQNLAAGDTANLRLFTFNSNNAANVTIDSIDIYYMDRLEITTDNPDGRRLVETIEGSVAVQEDTGVYLLSLELEQLKYVIGTYIDKWNVSVSDEEHPFSIEQIFEIYPNLWYSTPIPPVFDFNFRFQPNKMRKGSKQYIIIEIIPNTPTAGDLRKYYENLAIVSDLSISMEQTCGDCLPAECDLRLVIDDESVTYREKRYGYYQLDTTDMECGLYDIWFKLNHGTNIYISDRFKFQIYA